ncbi:MAG: DoxX family membrane protein [Bacteroidetes bacterium]|nr:DoxX family membrane protein [Bacteroidota bacterium]
MKAKLPQLFLRIALGIGYLVPGLDRLGVWGKNGAPGISWGDWQHFMQYAKEVMQFLPASIVPTLAVTATIGEITFGCLLLTGYFTRRAAIGSGVLSLCFAAAMAISFGIVSPLSYSVFTVSAASFLLAIQPQYAWSIDQLRIKNQS